MSTLKTAVLCSISICFFFSLLLSSGSSKGQSVESLQWGAPVDRLQMSLSATSSSKADVPQFQVAFRNAGEDLTLNLGMMLANGKVQLPDKISLTLSDASGKTRKLSFSDKRYPGVAGRIDDYIVRLRSGSIYLLKVGLDQFVSPDTNEYELRLSSGKYQITAQFEGSGARFINLDRPAIRLMNFWKGKVQSNTLAVER